MPAGAAMPVSDSESFGVELGCGAQAVKWINLQAQKDRIDLEARLYGHELATSNFGTFEMFSWIGDVRQARRLLVRASKRFRVKVLEGGYKTRERTLRLSKSDYAMIRKGDKIVGKVELGAPRIGGSMWKVVSEERR